MVNSKKMKIQETTTDCHHMEETAPWKYDDCNLTDLDVHSRQGSSAAQLHQNTDLHTWQQLLSLTWYHCYESETEQTTVEMTHAHENYLLTQENFLNMQYVKKSHRKRAVSPSVKLILILVCWLHSVNIISTDASIPKPDQNVSPFTRSLMLYLHATDMLTAAFHNGLKYKFYGISTQHNSQ